jgi:hypothetical protein
LAFSGLLVVPSLASAARPPEAVHHHRQGIKPQVARPNDDHGKNRRHDGANDKKDDRGKDKVDHDKNDDHGHDGANHK